jgi:predicted Zn-dependent protease
VSDDHLSADASDLQQRLQEASRLADDDRWPEAFELLLELEPQHPRDPTLLCMLGVVATEVDAGALAYDYYRRCLAEQPTDPYLLVTLGAGLARYDDPDAEGALRLAALSAPELALTRLHYGAHLAREGMLDLAVSELSAARDLDEADPRIARELGVARLLRGELELGLDELERAIGLTEEEGELNVLYGLGLLRAGRLEEAAEALHRAAAELTGDGEVQLVTALACAAQEWWDEAWDALTRAEMAEGAIDPEVVREAEDALEAGGDAAAALLLEQVAPPMLRERLLERP